MSLKLTPEDLGDAGESKFKLLCSQARLVCNKSSRDLRGVGFHRRISYDGALPSGRAGPAPDGRLPGSAKVDRGRNWWPRQTSPVFHLRKRHVSEGHGARLVPDLLIPARGVRSRCECRPWLRGQDLNL